MRKLLPAFLLLLAPLAAIAQVPVALMPIPHAQFLDANAHALAGGKVCFFNAGTTTPAATYVDVNGVILNSNPIVLDSGGFATIYLASQEYKVIVYDGSGNSSCPNTGVQQWSQDNVNAFQILVAAQSIILAPTIVDPAGTNGQLGFRSDIPCIRFFITVWDCFVGRNTLETLTNKTLTSPTITTPTITIPTITNPSINAVSIVNGPGTYVVLTNDGATGTSINRIAKLNGANPSAAITVSGVDTSGAIGICVSGCANTGSSTIQQSGTVLCTFDVAGATAGDYVQISASVSGSCHDAGATYPTSGQVIGRALATGAGGVNINLFGPELKPTSVSKVEGVNITPVTVGNTVTPTNLQTLTVSANEIGVNQQFCVSASGQIGDTAAPAITILLRLDAITIATPNLTLAAANSQGWTMKHCFVGTSTGVAGTIWSEGPLWYSSVSGGGIATSSTGQGSSIVIDTTSSHTLAIQVTWGAANVLNTITQNTFFLTRTN